MRHEENHMRLHVCMPRASCAWALVLVLVVLVIAGPARAQPVVDPGEGEKALRMLMLKYPEQLSAPPTPPSVADVRIFRVTPTIISVLDYSKGFAHTDLVTC